MEQKIVTRTYKTKKGIVTKTYTYDKQTTEFYQRKNKVKRPTRITTASGKLIKKNYQAYIATMQGSDKLNANAIIRSYQKQGKLLTETRLEYEINKQQIVSVLDTAGLSIEQICEETGSTREQILDINNWNTTTTKNGKQRVGSIFTNPETGKSYKFDVDYNGTAVMVDINEIN